MALLPGVFQAQKKDGTIYYRSSISFRAKHISLGSFSTQNEAGAAYEEARELFENADTYTPDDYYASRFPHLSYAKWICLINFKNNGFYIKTPIYMRQKFFSYHLSPKDILFFDADDLFYYSNHSIMRRGNHLFVSDYGMQTNIHSRYGIKNFARLGIDYRFVNGDTRDFRYSNIEIINIYHGVTCIEKSAETIYVAKIHIHGDFIIGKYSCIIDAAVAYNKAVDILKEKKLRKNFEKNYIEELNSKEYKEVYDKLIVSKKILQYEI